LKGLRARNTHVPDKEAPRYTLSRGGYALITQVIMKEMFEERVWEAMVIGMDEDEARSTVAYPRPQDVPRFEKWIRGHMSKDGAFKGFRTKQALDMATKIVSHFPIFYHF